MSPYNSIISVTMFFSNSYSPIERASSYENANDVKLSHLPAVTAKRNGPIVLTYEAGIFVMDKDEDYRQIGFADEPITVIVSAPELQQNSVEFSEVVDTQSGPDKNTAILLARLSKLAYEKNTVVKSKLRRDHGLTQYSEIRGKSTFTDTHGFITGDQNKIIVVFRGSKSIKNFITDILAYPKKINPNSCNAQIRNYKGHGGFVTALNTVYEKVMVTLTNDPRFEKKQLYITGHSLGGALAALLAFRLEANGIAKPKLYSFGCPPVGDRAYYGYTKNTYSAPSYTIYIRYDPVSNGYVANIAKALGFFLPYKEISLKTFYKPRGIPIYDHYRLLANHNIDNYIKRLKGSGFKGKRSIRLAKE